MLTKRHITILLISFFSCSCLIGQTYRFSAEEFSDGLYEKEVVELVVSGFGLDKPDPSAEETIEFLEINLSDILDGIDPIKTNKRIKGINKIENGGYCCLRFTSLTDDTTHGYELDFSKIVCSTIEIVRKNHPQTFAYGYAIKMATKDGLQYVARLSNDGWLIGNQYNASSLEFYDWTGKAGLTVEEMDKMRRAFVHACKKCGGFAYDEPDFPDY